MEGKKHDYGRKKHPAWQGSSTNPRCVSSPRGSKKSRRGFPGVS